MKCPGHTQDQVNQNLRGWDPGIRMFTSFPGNSTVNARGRTTSLHVTSTLRGPTLLLYEFSGDRVYFVIPFRACSA